MFKSLTISVQIERPLAEVYEFLAEPRNFPTWASNLGTSFKHLSGNDWVTDTRSGRVILRFAERNAFGILDHAVFAEGSSPRMTPMRVFANGEGTELSYTLLQRGGITDAAFQSEAEWVTSDFNALKAMLELQDEIAFVDAEADEETNGS